MIGNNAPDRNGRFQPVGACVYCGVSDCKLTDEHIIPYALGGNVVLPQASCESCARTTSKFERRFCREMFGQLRLRGKLPSRKNKNKTGTVGLETDKGLISFPVEGIHVARIIYDFVPAGILRNPPVKQEQLECRPIVQIEPGSDRAFHDGVEEVTTLPITYDPYVFALQVAKIALCHAVGVFGFGNFDPWLPPYILGDDKAIGFLIGGEGGDAGRSANLHEVTTGVQIFGREPKLVSKVRLFSVLGGPWSYAVVGRMSNAAYLQWRMQHEAERGNRCIPLFE